MHKNGFLFLLLIIIAGLVIFYSIKDNTQLKLNQEIYHSLELNQQASGLLNQGNSHGAKELLLESLALNKLNMETRVLLGLANLNLENYQEAYEYLVGSINMGATSVDITEKLVHVLVKSGHYSEARKYLHDGLDVFGGDARLIFLKGKLFYLEKNYAKAIGDLQGLLESGIPEDLEGDVFVYLGLSYYYFGELEEAKGYYLKYLNDIAVDSKKDIIIDVLHQEVLEKWAEGNG